MQSYLEKGASWLGESDLPRLFGLPVFFSPDAAEEPCWAVINFALDKEPGIPVHYPYFRMSP